MTRVYADRFELREPIANGAFGVVYEAYDRERDELVALKSVRYDRPEDVRLLKREFRVLRDVTHPHLLPLHHLACDEGEWFFTMALISGSPFAKVVRALRSGEDYRKIAELFRGMAEGLAHLHSHGILHRDLKPENVVVTSEDQAVLLDFGLSTRLRLEASRRSRQGTFSGSAAYAAPEQLFGEDLSPAADWFAMGMMLYEAISGARPTRDELGMDVDPSRALGETVPDALSALTWKLLSPEPEHRPKYGQIRRMLEEVAHSAPSGGLVTAEPARVVGRDLELELLDHWRREVYGNTVTVQLLGPPGVGKSNLAEVFFQERERKGDLVLRSVCHPNERVPYNAIDGLIDDAVRFLRGQPLGFVRASVPEAMAPLAAMFPALGELAPVLLDDRLYLDTDQLRRASDQLIQFLSTLAQRRPLSLLIDNIQWADRDSRRLLERIQNQRGAGIFVICTSEAEFKSGLEPKYTLTLGPLQDAEAELFSKELARRYGLSEEAARHAVAVAGGHPYFAQLVGMLVSETADEEDAPTSLQEVIHRELDRLEPDEQELLELVALSSTPLERGAVADALTGALPLEALRDRLERRQLLALWRRGQATALVVPHRAVQVAIRERIQTRGEDTVKALHGRIIDVLVRGDDGDPFALIHHLEAANRAQEACEHALKAAALAERSLAFDNAVELFQAALRLMPDEAIGSAERLRLARMYELSGRARDAGQAALQALEALEAEDADGGLVLETMTMAVSQLLRGGALDDALPWVKQVLHRIGLSWHGSLARTLLSVVWNRLALRVPATVRTPNEEERRYMNVLWEVSSGLSFYDSARAFELQARHARMARKFDDSRHRSLALSNEALLKLFQGGERYEDDAIRMLTEANAVAAGIDDPHAEAHRRLMRCMVLYTSCHYDAVDRETVTALAYCRRNSTGSTWERAGLFWIRCCALSKLRRYEDLAQVIEEARREATRLGDAYLDTMLSLGPCAIASLASDEPELAIRAANEARERAGINGFLDYLYAYIVGRARLYQGDVLGARDVAAARMKLAQRGGMGRAPLVRMELLDLQGRAGLAMMATDTQASEGEQLVLAAIKGLRKTEISMAKPSAALLEAQLNLLRGKRPRAGLLLAVSSGGFDRVGIPVDAAMTSIVANWVQGRGPREDALWPLLLEAGVTKPELFVRTVLPAIGFSLDA